MIAVPGYWMHETSGVLQPAVTAYLEARPLSDEHIALLRAYLRQWIEAPCWSGDSIAELRGRIDSLTTREPIVRWIDDAVDLGIDPL